MPQGVALGYELIGRLNINTLAKVEYKNMRKTIITILLTLIAMMGQAQEQGLKMNEPSINDYIPLLNAKGYIAYSFDVSAIKGRNVTCTF